MTSFNAQEVPIDIKKVRADNLDGKPKSNSETIQQLICL
uniref:Uncharacterized protein n=1 Tax=Vibrio cholerae Ind4 TaxID=663958 RepID=C9E536_VIBCL|nr:hypothetical protein ICEVCHIND4_0077 [Vibrio cholerae Ind4]